MTLRATYAVIFITALTISYIQGKLYNEVVGGTILAITAVRATNSFYLFDK
jgi:uncharacterized membrane protein